MATGVGTNRSDRCANFAADGRRIGHPRAGSLRPDGLVWHSGRGEPADSMAISTCGFVSLLSEGGRAELGSQGHLLRHDAVYDDSTPGSHPAVCLPATGALATQSNVWWVNHDASPSIYLVIGKRPAC